jgi:LmbE family N-acetylglucosaminyl deacetylase
LLDKPVASRGALPRGAVGLGRRAGGPRADKERVVLESKRRILVLGPHTDDGELGCGGLMAKRTELGHDVIYAVFSSCQRSVPEGLPPDILQREVRRAVEVLGMNPERQLILMDYEVRTFPEQRQAILEDLIRLRSDLKPDLVLCPSLNDVHQDHATICREAIRAFKKQSILCYEEPWNNITFSSHVFETLEPRHLQKKMKALAAYESQRHRTYFQEDVMRSLAVTRGAQLEGGFAEAFEVVRWML